MQEKRLRRRKYCFRLGETQDKFNPRSAPSLVKTDRLYGEKKLSKDEDPGNWITNLEDPRIILDVMDQSISDNWLMAQILIRLRSNYILKCFHMKSE
jgi:hypothetical protein